MKERSLDSLRSLGMTELPLEAESGVVLTSGFISTNPETRRQNGYAEVTPLYRVER